MSISTGSEKIRSTPAAQGFDESGGLLDEAARKNEGFGIQQRHEVGDQHRPPLDTMTDGRPGAPVAGRSTGEDAVCDVSTTGVTRQHLRPRRGLDGLSQGAPAGQLFEERSARPARRSPPHPDGRRGGTRPDCRGRVGPV